MGEPIFRLTDANDVGGLTCQACRERVRERLVVLPFPRGEMICRRCLRDALAVANGHAMKVYVVWLDGCGGCEDSHIDSVHADETAARFRFSTLVAIGKNLNGDRLCARSRYSFDEVEVGKLPEGDPE